MLTSKELRTVAQDAQLLLTLTNSELPRAHFAQKEQKDRRQQVLKQSTIAFLAKRGNIRINLVRRVASRVLLELGEIKSKERVILRLVTTARWDTTPILQMFPCRTQNVFRVVQELLPRTKALPSVHFVTLVNPHAAEEQRVASNVQTRVTTMFVEVSVKSVRFSIGRKEKLVTEIVFRVLLARTTSVAR
jgi:23S rRNA G2445 N2-methylase RlmL